MALFFSAGNQIEEVFTGPQHPSCFPFTSVLLSLDMLSLLSHLALLASLRERNTPSEVF